MSLEGDLTVMADIGFPKTAERIREEMRRQNQAVRYTSDLYEQMDAERKRQDAELERLRQAEQLAKRFAKAKGRYHSQQAMCDLMEHFGVPCLRPGDSNAETTTE
ncbi:hypothetical protein MRB56_09305 [Halomonas cupida]|uniref:hypothetical protein n=1 Tax=Halomonas cupida TaxID=44933 RepID=UPI0039B6CA49